MSAPPVVAATGLRVERDGKVLLRDVDIHAHAGEVLGVLGPSGAGKSTFFRALAGELDPVRGEVRLGGVDVTSEPLYRRARMGLGYMPQSPSVLFDLTVRANLETFFRVARRPGRASGDARDDRARTAGGRVDPRAEAPELAARVGLDTRLEVRAGDLSAGERRRLEFARAVVAQPRVLICDEPFAGVDPRGAAHLGELLRGLSASGVAVLLADHHVAEALRICTRAVLLLDGAVAVEADPASFRRHPLVEGRYLGTLDAGPVAAPVAATPAPVSASNASPSAPEEDPAVPSSPTP